MLQNRLLNKKIIFNAIWWILIIISFFSVMSNARRAIHYFKWQRHRSHGMDSFYSRAGGIVSVSIFIEDCRINNIKDLLYPEEPVTDFAKQIEINYLKVRMFPIKCIEKKYRSYLTEKEAVWLESRAVKSRKIIDNLLFYCVKSGRNNNEDYAIYECMEKDKTLLFIAPVNWNELRAGVEIQND